MLTLMILGQTPTVDSVLKRLDQYLSKADTLSVSTKSKLNGTQISVGSLRIDRPGRMNVTAKFNGVEALFIINERGGLEIDRGTQAYAEHPNFGRLYIPKFKIHGGLLYVVPTALVRGSSLGMFPAELKPTVTPKVVVNGVTTDLIFGRLKNQMAEVEVKAWIDTEGRLVKFYTKQVGQDGTTIAEYDMSGYVANQKIPETAFSTKFPLGYTPFELSRADTGLPQGQPVPNVQLKAADTGANASLKDLIAGKNTLVLIADPEFHANTALLQSIKNVSAKIPDFRLVVISNRRDAAAAKRIGSAGAFYDPTGREIGKLDAPGAPTMFLIDKKGVLAQMFFGFDGSWERLDKAIERLKG
jgi:hypothetical protein